MPTDLQQFFRWLVDEGEVTASPMARMRPPKPDDKPVPVTRDSDLNALLGACAGQHVDARRPTTQPSCDCA
jgi:site-specific recombinase XerC